MREIEQRRPAVPSQPKPSLEVEGSTRAATEPGDAARFRVTSIRISGATAFSDLELLPFLDGIAGRDVTLAELEAGAARITQFYRSHGYPVARAYVPAQNVENGGVEIAVLEGRYGKLDVRNHTRLSDSVVRSTLRAPAADNVIETAPLDHDMLLLKDLAGVAVEATLTPGELVGTSDLVVDITAAPTWSGTLEADTFGNDYTGELRFGGSVAAANLAG
ncbi:MAG TPA: POTRA domain-containing protein, partial [Pseudomonadales bacterium]